MKRLPLLVCIALLSGAAVGCGQQAPKNMLPAWTADQGAGQGGAADSGEPARVIEPIAGRAGGEAEKPRADAGTSSPKPMGGAAAPAPMTNMVVGEPRSGAAISISEDDTLALAVNRDLGSVSVFGLEFDKEALKQISLRKELLLEPSSEPYQVVLAPDGQTGYVVLRRDQALVKLGSLASEPKVLERVAVGSEPTGVALNGDASRAYVTNWNDGTLSVVDTSSMKLVRTVDLNAALVAGGYLGSLQPRAALAHPRSIAVGDGVLYVTEFYAQQIEAEDASGANADTHKVGVVYKITLPDWSVSTLQLAALADMVFRDDKRGQAGCFPNQLQSIAINSQFVYVISVCASPEGPLGVKLTTTACTSTADCPAGMVEPACVTPFAGAANQVCADVASVKTTTAPVISILDTSTGRELASGAVNLNARFDALYKLQQTDATKQRFPLFASEIAFVPGTTVGYVSANGSDAVFRFQTDAMSGEIQTVGATTNAFIDLVPEGVPADKAGKNPIGIAIAHQHKKIALVANEVTRNVSALDFNTQALSGGAAQPKAAVSAGLPVPGSNADHILRGKRFFNTGTGRWSLRGQGWGACQSCHADGLSDNVTWYFARGPRQSTSLDGSFASTHPDDQRMFNWTAINDEVADFELNTRGVSGGVGAIVSDSAAPIATAQRIDFQGLGHAALNGSAKSAADPQNPLQLAAAPKLADWDDIEKYMQTIRSPRAPTGLDKAQVEMGRTLFNDEANCQGCHGGEKWTVSRRFYTPSTASNGALLTTKLAGAAEFPSSLLPARQSAHQTLRFQGDNVAALDQILCVLRPVGTYNIAEPGVGIAELRADRTTAAQGGGDAAGDGSGFNVPALLGVSTGAPYLHAGNVRTLEALFSERFAQHHRALSANFLTENDESERTAKVSALIQYLLSIDEQAAYPALPSTGASGGSLCPQSF
jgi:DNA-binding beta-propeller fold protein YncE